MTYSFHVQAQNEFLDQLSYYKKINQELAEDFRNTVAASIEQILALPEAWTIIDMRATRRKLVKKYPFAILYKYDKSKKHVRILALMNTARRPGYWKNRE